MIIVGEGLLATSIIMALKSRGIQFKHYKYHKEFRGITRASSGFRSPAIISDSRKGGLSMSYHGVTPGAFLKTTLSQLFFPKIGYVKWMSDYSFVPRRIPRPQFFTNQVISKVEMSDKSKVILASSVVGNLEISENKSVQIGDHVIIKLGSISKMEVNNIKMIRYFKGLVFHRHFNSDKARLFMRPYFGQKTAINFGDSVNGRLFFILKNLTLKKLFEALYLRFGIAIVKFHKYSIYAQIPITDAYEFCDNKWRETINFNERLQKIVSIEMLQLQNKFKSFEEVSNWNDNVITGIHLFYNRKSTKFKMWDTSLSENSLDHPTLMSCAIAYEHFLNKKYD